MNKQFNYVIFVIEFPEYATFSLSLLRCEIVFGRCNNFTLTSSVTASGTSVLIGGVKYFDIENNKVTVKNGDTTLGTLVVSKNTI